MQALQNACSSFSLALDALPPALEPALRDAANELPVRLAEIAFGALSNIHQLRVAESLRNAPEGSVVGVRCVPPEVGTPHLFLPSPLHRPDAVDPPTGGHRAIPMLCQELQLWCKPTTQRRAVCSLGQVIGARTLDADAAVLLLFHCKAVPLLLKLLDADPDAHRSTDSCRAGRPPTQPDLVGRRQV